MQIKFPVVLVLVVAFVIHSCSSSDDLDAVLSTPDAELRGDWVAQSFGGVIDSETDYTDSLIENTVVVTIIEGNIDSFKLNVTANNFTASGSYTTNVIEEGSSTPVFTSYPNVIEMGTYSATEDTLMYDGKFYELEVEGLPFMVNSSEAYYDITGNTLTIREFEEEVTSQISKVVIERKTLVSTWIKAQ